MEGGETQLRGPDFLGIGAPICGTTWLYQNLRLHPSVWMSDIKEFHYLDSQRDQGWRSRWYRAHLYLFARISARSILDGKFPGDLGWWARYFLCPRNDRWYGSLLSNRSRRLCGEITPRYAYVAEPVVRDFSRVFPRVRLILLVRDPIERSWSYATKRLASERGRRMSDVSEAEIDSFFQRDKFLGGLSSWNDYAEIVRKWTRYFGRDQLFVGFYEELEQAPKTLIDRICRFLGIEPLPEKSAGLVSKRFSSTREVQVPIPRVIERYIARRVLDSVDRLASMVGGPANDWRVRARRAAELD